MKPKFFSLSRILVTLLISCGGGAAMATEQPSFQVIEKFATFELREYGGTLVAETTVEADRDTASTEGFRRLAGYIFGGNSGEKKIAMTAPVTQTAGQKIAMTAPVTQTAVVDNQWLIQFTMPASFKSLEELPRPNDSRVTLRAVPGRTVAVIQYAGVWSEELYARQLASLRAGLVASSLTPIGEPTWARYDPPWMPWFMRTNEIQLQVKPAP